MTARLGGPDAAPVLAGALRVHDAEFTRAGAALRTDLAVAYLAADDTESAATLLQHAITIADTVGSLRQRGRLASISPLLKIG